MTKKSLITKKHTRKGYGKVKAKNSYKALKDWKVEALSEMPVSKNQLNLREMTSKVGDRAVIKFLRDKPTILSGHNRVEAMKKLESLHEIPVDKEYTKIRRFYAWVGFVVIFLALAIALIWGLYAISGVKRMIAISNEQIPVTTIVYGYSVESTWGVVSAYSSEPEQTDDTPFVTASGKWVDRTVVANNCLPFGTTVIIDQEIYQVNDRMNTRYGCDHFDIWVGSRAEALERGRELKIVIIIQD